MECRHSSISLVNEFPQCLVCGMDFKNGELGKLRRERENNCKHPNLRHGYASNPPKAYCSDCGGYFKY